MGLPTRAFRCSSRSRYSSESNSVTHGVARYGFTMRSPTLGSLPIRRRILAPLASM